MPLKSFAPIALIVTLLLVALAAGLVGGYQFEPDVATIHHLATVRAESPGLTIAAIWITHTGSVYGTIGGGLAASGWLAWQRQRLAAGLLAATIFVERLVIDGLKLIIDRPRPTFDLHPVVTHSSSFPSGHSGNSMAVFLAIALIAVPRVHRTAAILVAVAASMLVGATRPFLGVHWPSDVVGGWAIGAAIAIVVGAAADRLPLGAAKEEHQIVGGHRVSLDQK